MLKDEKYTTIDNARVRQHITPDGEEGAQQTTPALQVRVETKRSAQRCGMWVHL